jgi:hypothetical protein
VAASIDLAGALRFNFPRPAPSPAAAVSPLDAPAPENDDDDANSSFHGFMGVWTDMTTGKRRLTPLDRPWRVFLSHTSELREHPAPRSFVAAAEAATLRAGHAVSDMAYFAARDAACAEHCARMVRRSDVYVGIVGVRYGSAVLGRSDHSYVELEFEVATEMGVPRLIFLISADSPALPPPAQSRRRCARQVAFRERLLAVSGLTVARVRWPAQLELELLHALGELRAESVCVRCNRGGRLPA